MSRWTPRSSFLLLFSVANLIFWVLVAVVVGLAVSDKMDLGVETLIRERQATVVVVWKQAVVRASKRSPEPTSAGYAPAAQATEPVKVTPTVAGTPSPSVLVPQDPTQQPVVEPTVRAPFTPIPTQEQPTAQSEVTPVSRPLLVSDPEFGNLTRMDQEMSRSAVGRTVLIRYSEDSLNEEIQVLLQNNAELPYRNVHVDLRRDHVVVTGDVTVLGFQVSTEVEGIVIVEDCLPRMMIRSISIGGVLTPGLVKDKIRGLLSEAMDWYPADYPLCIEQIVLEEDRATVYGRRR